METKILIDLGLTEDEAKIYNSLLEGGLMPARMVALKSGVGRQLTYKVLDDLIKKEIVEKKETGTKILLFAPVHPRELEKLLTKKKEEVENTKKALEESLGGMISKYNLFIGKPNVQFFEGNETIEKITGDYPKEDKEIRQWIDVALATNEIGGKFFEYLGQRIKKGISKRMILPNNPKSEEYANRGAQMTEMRIEKNLQDLPTAIQVYDNTVTMLTLEENKKIGLIIEDTSIAETLKKIFDSNWKKLTPPSLGGE